MSPGHPLGCGLEGGGEELCAVNGVLSVHGFARTHDLVHDEGFCLFGAMVESGGARPFEQLGEEARVALGVVELSLSFGRFFDLFRVPPISA